jgi:hypothetical protein
MSLDTLTGVSPFVWCGQVSRRSLPGFSAACWYFGEELDKGINAQLKDEEKVSIGLVASFVGGKTLAKQTTVSTFQHLDLIFHLMVQGLSSSSGSLRGTLATANNKCAEMPRVAASMVGKPSIRRFVEAFTTDTLLHSSTRRSLVRCGTSKPRRLCSSGPALQWRVLISLGGFGAMDTRRGENNVRNIAGSVSNHSGYACQQQLQIAEYRRMWSTTPGTTDPYFPFGVTQLAGYSSEGFPWNSGAFRLAQTGGYGYMPNKAIPNSFLGQAFGATASTIRSPVLLQS